MTDRDALYRAILAHPADDTPRLVYADWLEENGRGEEAEFMRLDCRLEAGAPDDPAFVEMHARREELRLWLTAHVVGPALKLPSRLRVASGAGWWKATQRGFPCFLVVDGVLDSSSRALRSIVGSMEKAFARLPTRWLVVRQVNIEQLAELLRYPVLSSLQDLTVQLHPTEDPQDEACRLIAECPYLENLRGLALDFPAGDAGAAALGRARIGLKQLRLDQCSLMTPGAIRALGSSAWFRGLAQLVFSGLGDAAFEELCRIQPLQNLHTLELHDSSFTTASWGLFARSTTFPRLSSLRNGTEMAAGQTEVLAEATGIKLAVLNLKACGIGNDGALALTRAPWLESLRWLNLSWNGLTASGFAAMAGSRLLAGLRYLDLSFNAPGIRGLRTLAANPTLEGLTTLLIQASPDHKTSLTQKHSYEFLATLKTTSLRRLGLSHLPLGEPGARALSAEKFGNLTRLHVAGCKLSDAAMSQLLSSRTLQNLVELDASQNESRTVGALLTDRRVLPQLSAANFTDNRLPSDLIRKLKRRPGFIA